MDKIDAGVTRLGDFLTIGQLLEALCNFKEVAQRNDDILGYFLFVQVFK
jgi:hypothetical protein